MTLAELTTIPGMSADPAYNPPRLFSPRHPRAVGSYGAEAIAYSESRSLHPKRSTGTRQWQRVVLDRALEHDVEGALVWPVVIVSAPRQSGKSWVERIVCDWRIHQAERFGEEQSVLHVAHKLQAAAEVWRPAARFAYRAGDRVQNRFGEQLIELDDGSRWMISAANDGSGVAFSLSMALVDEVWRVSRAVVDDAIEPTMAESASPQLWLVSTAGTSDSDLMLTRRAAAIADLGAANPSAMIAEWSAPPIAELDIDDPNVWRACSPHWDERRLSVVAGKRGLVGERSFRQQWLNQWVPSVGSPLIDSARWPALLSPSGPSGEIAFGIDVAPDRSYGVIVGYGGGVAEVVAVSRNPERVEPVPGEGVGWLVDWLASRAEAHGGAWVVGGDALGPAGSVLAELTLALGAGRVVAMNGRETAAASGTMFDRMTATPPGVAFVDHPMLSESVCNARWRNYGQTRTFSRDETGSGAGVALVAATAAIWASEHVPALDLPGVF